MDAGLLGIALGGAAICAAFGGLGLALSRDYRGITSSHVRRTMRMVSAVSRRADSQARFDRQYRLERHVMGPSFLVAGFAGFVACLVAFGIGLGVG